MHTRKIGPLSLFLASSLLWTLGSCQAAANYGKERVADFADCFALVIAPGSARPVYSAAAGIEISRRLPIGLGLSVGTAYGLVGRRAGSFDYTLLNGSIIVYAIEDLLNADTDIIEEAAEGGLYFTTELSPNKYAGRNRDRDFRIGANLGLSVFYLYADVELGEIVDFALGILGLDIMGDDSSAPIEELHSYPGSLED